MLEAELRDLICSDISILGSGLVLISKEKYIPNELGTRSFIDIYAKDQDGHHVLIEIKRSNEASREAINEIIKYVEGIKRHFGARDNEIKVIIASTEWKELLVPYSRFLSESTISINALKISVDKKTITTTPIQPLNFEKGRFIAPWYDIHWYKNSVNLNRGLKSLKKKLLKKKIHDYVITILKSKVPITSPSKERRIRVLKSIFSSGNEVEATYFNYILITAIQVKTHQEYKEIIIKSGKTEDEIEEVFSICDDDDYDDEDKLCILHEYAMEDTEIEHDDFEIGYPAKLQKYLNDDRLVIHEVIREGVFKRNLLLEDSIIISELCGDKGNAKQGLKTSALLNNTAHMSVLRDDVTRVLQTNVVWLNQILRILKEVEHEFHDASIEVNVFYPSTGVFCIYYMLKNESTDSLPNYYISVSDSYGHKIRNYFGCLQQNGMKNSFNKILSSYYDNNIHQLIHTITWGGRDERDIDILEDMGLTYRSFYFDTINKDVVYSLKDERWRVISTNQISLKEYLVDNKELIGSMISEISFFDQGDIFSAPDIQTNIVIEKEEVDDQNYNKLINFFNMATSSISAMRHLQGQLNISFNGYHNDPELYEINSFRDYVKNLSSRISCFLFFINPEEMLEIFLLCYVKIKRYNKGIIVLNPEKIKIFFELQKPELERLLIASGFSEDEKTTIRDKIQKIINKFDVD